MKSNNAIKILFALLLTTLFGVFLYVMVHESSTYIDEANAEGSKEFFYYESSTNHLRHDGVVNIDYATNELLVTYVSGTSDAEVDRIATKIDGKVVGKNAYLNKAQILLDKDYSFQELSNVASVLEKSEHIVSVAPNVFLPLKPCFIPNDSRWTSIWGETPGGENWGLEAINAPAMWDLYFSVPTNRVNVAVIDWTFFTGLDDLEFAGTFHNPSDDEDVDLDYYQKMHGTFVAGILAASFNNGRKISGVCPNVNLYGASMYGLRNRDVQTNSDGAYVSALEAALTYAIAIKECKVINFSMLYCDSTNPTLSAITKKEIESCLSQYVNEGFEFVIVQSSGNDCVDINEYTPPDCLISSENPSVKNRLIVVGATELVNGKINVGYYSNFGSRVDVVAPGSNIVSLCKKDSYHPQGLYADIGTSFAAPHVSGIAANLFAVNPNLTGPEVKDIICSTAKGNYTYTSNASNPAARNYSYKMVDGYAALKELLNRMNPPKQQPSVDPLPKELPNTSAGNATSNNTNYTQQKQNGNSSGAKKEEPAEEKKDIFEDREVDDLGAGVYQPEDPSISSGKEEGPKSEKQQEVPNELPNPEEEQATNPVNEEVSDEAPETPADDVTETIVCVEIPTGSDSNEPDATPVVESHDTTYFDPVSNEEFNVDDDQVNDGEIECPF